MRVVAGVGFFFVLAGLAGLAQSGQPLPGTGVSPACPLDMHVRQRAGGTLVSTDAQGRRTETFAARLKLEVKDLRPDRSSRQMVSAKVTVRGWTPEEQILPLDSGNDRNGNLVKT